MCWEIDIAKLAATTTDNGSNFVAAINSLEWIRISCFRHNLDLAVNKALNVECVYRAAKKMLFSSGGVQPQLEEN